VYAKINFEATHPSTYMLHAVWAVARILPQDPGELALIWALSLTFQMTRQKTIFLLTSWDDSN